MNFSDLLKSIDHQRQQERLVEEEVDTRSFDFGRQVAATSTRIVDNFIAQRAVPVANRLVLLYEKAIRQTYTQEEAVSKFNRFEQELPTYRQRMTDEAKEILAEKKHLMIEQGVEAEIDEYIKAKLNTIVVRLEESSRSTVMDAEARLRWLISGEEDTISLEAFKAQREHDSG